MVNGFNKLVSLLLETLTQVNTLNKVNLIKSGKIVGRIGMGEGGEDPRKRLRVPHKNFSKKIEECVPSPPPPPFVKL